MKPRIIKAKLVLAVALGTVLSACTHLFFKPTTRVLVDPEILNYSPLDVYFRSADGTLLHGWYLRAREEKGTILVCHGNAENIGTHVKLDLWLVDEGYNLFIFDYRGYGRSQGAPEVTGIHLDAGAALETVLFALTRGTQKNVIVFGKSLGGAVAVYSVAHSPYKNRIRALILDSPFSSYRTIAREKIAESIIGWPVQYPLSYLVNDDYSPVKFIRNVAPVPVLIVHGNRDTIVPVHHGRILYESALPPKEFWEVALSGHVRAQADEGARSRILAFLSALP